MLTWLHRWLVNRRNIGPKIPADGICGIDGCQEPANNMWCPSVCALREAGIEVEWVLVCAEHDVQSNEETTRFFFGDKFNRELAEYRARRITT